MTVIAKVRKWRTDRQWIEDANHFLAGVVCSFVLGPIGLGLWVTYSVLREFWWDGHAQRIIQGKESRGAFVDLCVDMTTRLAGPVLWVIL